MKTAKEIIDAKLHNVENGIYSCEDRVCDVADEIIAAMNEFADQFIKSGKDYVANKILGDKPSVG